MAQTGQGWTQYHDFLMQQAIAMMAEPDWANNPALMSQLTPIQDELKAAGASLGSQDQDIKDLFGQFEQAYQDGVRQNETRYGQLLQDNAGQSPTVYNQETGRWDQNPNYQAPLSYQQRIGDLTGAGGVYDQAQQRFDSTATQQQQQLATATQGLGDRSTTLGAHANALESQARGEFTGAANQFDARSGAIGGQIAGDMGGYRTAYQGENGILSGFGDRTAQIGSEVSGVRGNLGSALSDLTSRYGTREQDLQGLLQGYGNIQRDDLNRSYDALSQKQSAEMQNRGLGNSTVMSSVQGGVENQRQLDRTRLEDQLRREQLGYQSQWSQDALSAREREAMSNAQLGMQGAEMNAQLTAEQLAARQGFSSENLQAGFNQANLNAGLMGDAASARMQAAGQNSQAGQNALNANMQLTGDYWGAQQQAALANAQANTLGANWAGHVAGVRNQLTGDPLRAIEARTDITPSLGDVANMALQVGTSQATQFALPGMSPTSYYQQPTGSKVGY